MSGEVTLKRRSVPDRLRYCAEQLAATMPRRDDAVIVAAVRQILEDTAVELDGVLGAPVLSDREMDALERLAAGLSRQQIADDMGVSVHTVGSHLKRVFVQLGASSRGEAVAVAHRLGLLSVERVS